MRKKYGMTQQEVSRLLYITRSTYAYYECGKNVPQYDSLVKLAELYGVTVDYLLGRPGTDPQTLLNQFFAYFAVLPLEDQLIIYYKIKRLFNDT